MKTGRWNMWSTITTARRLIRGESWYQCWHNFFGKTRQLRYENFWYCEQIRKSSPTILYPETKSTAKWMVQTMSTHVRADRDWQMEHMINDFQNCPIIYSFPRHQGNHWQPVELARFLPMSEIFYAFKENKENSDVALLALQNCRKLFPGFLTFWRKQSRLDIISAQNWILKLSYSKECQR